MTKEHNVEIALHNFKNKYKCDMVLCDTTMSTGLRVASKYYCRKPS